MGHWLADAAAGALGGEVLATPLGPCVLVERRYAADHVHGLVPLAPCAGDLDPACAGFALLAGAAHAPDERGAIPHAQRPLLFVDLETTGLAGGAGTHAFLVGCAWFDGEVFRVQQFFMVGHALERALLGAVRDRLDAGGSLVTYNGRTFDVPLLETRYLFHRQTLPFGARPHLDMLPVARRLWRYARPIVDVPGTADRQLLARRARARAVRRAADRRRSRLRDPGPLLFVPAGAATPRRWSPSSSTTGSTSYRSRCSPRARSACSTMRLMVPNRPRECLGLGRILERVGLLDRAERCYGRADLAHRGLLARRRRDGSRRGAARPRPPLPALRALRRGLDALGSD